MSEKIEEAVRLFSGGYNCAQAVACGCGRGFGIDRDGLLAVAGAFGGGIGSTGRVCGAVSGAVMVIGLKHPRIDPKDPIPKQETVRLTRELIARFEARHGSVDCKQLLGYDVSIPEEAKKAQDSGIFRTACPQFVRSAAEILEEIQ